MNRDFSSQNNNRPPFSVFLAATIVIFVLTLSVADSLGLVPDYIDGTGTMALDSDREIAPATESLEVSNLPELGREPMPAPVVETEAVATVKPTRIVIPAIDMNLVVQNPSTRDINALDALLQKGPARYVDSAELGEKGNIIIFAHSSNLPVVKNQMYKAFNRVKELETGDTITLVGADGKKYLYSVVSLRKANAEEATIDLSPRIGTKLTLVTCDTLTSKSSRYILEADFIGAIN